MNTYKDIKEVVNFSYYSNESLSNYRYIKQKIAMLTYRSLRNYYSLSQIWKVVNQFFALINSSDSHVKHDVYQGEDYRNAVLANGERRYFGD